MLLTIAIPTYKRCKYAVQNVKYLLPQVLAHKDSVSLLVTDNHSEDGTFEELSILANRYKEVFTLYEQEKNIGWMNNFFFGIEHSDSEFVFLLGDDDIVSPNFLDIVLPILKNGGDNLGMLHFNYIMASENLNNGRLLRPDLENEEMIVRYKEASEFVIKHNVGPSFISSVVFRKSSMLRGKRLNLQADTMDYSWFLCLLTGIVGQEVVYYKMPLCVQRVGGFYPRYCMNYVIGMYNVFKYLDPYMPGVLMFWKAHFSKEHNKIAMCINQIIFYRDLYMPYYDMFEEALPTTDLKHLLKVALKWKEAVAKKYFRLYWMRKRLFK